ncbi:MAG: Resolvase protein [Mucilaginibacter sp.]|nr:Resolvase protein [Mucilaginibacter sp.]
MEEICKEIILDVYQQEYEVKGDGRKELIARIDELTARQKNARELLLKGDLDGVDYREIKSECEAKINALEAKISVVPMSNHSIEDDLERAIMALSSINGLVSLEDGKLSVPR